MDVSRRLFPGALALAGTLALVGGCAAGADAPTFGVPLATLAHVRLIPCPGRVPAAAEATRCPEEPR